MAAASFEKLSGLDRSFLALENESAHMHLGATLVFEGGSLVDAQGNVDLERLQAYTEARLHRLPRYRQRLGDLPLGPDLFWTDDPEFDVRRHVRAARLPEPGGDAELKEVAARIASEPLDHTRPLWEVWAVDGLAGGRFALIAKTHHCLTDGVAAVDLLAALLTPQVVDELEPSAAWKARPQPGVLQLWGTALRDALGRQLGAVRAVRKLVQTRGELEGELREELEAASEALAGLRPTSRTRLNQPIGATRRVDWCVLPLAELREIRARLGGTLNDVVLAIVAGALRSWLAGHGEPVSALDLRALVPVSVRPAGTHGEAGNRIALWLVDLPVEEADPCLRHEQVRAVTRELKGSSKTLGSEALARMTSWTSVGVLSRVASLIPHARPFTLLVTNVPGPQIPLWLLDAKLEAAYPLAPLFRDQVLAVAQFSYAGRLFWGLNADREHMPDLARFREALVAAFDELRAAAAQAQPG